MYLFDILKKNIRLCIFNMFLQNTLDFAANDYTIRSFLKFNIGIGRISTP
jgi:hypothetical protein